MQETSLPFRAMHTGCGPVLFVVASSSILGRDQHNCYFAENRSRRSSANNTIEREDEILLGEGEEFTMPAQQADHPVCVWMSFGQTDDLFLPSPQKRGRQEGRGQLRHKTRASREEATRMEVSFSRCVDAKTKSVPPISSWFSSLHA